jgi:hypothetical protein
MFRCYNYDDLVTMYIPEEYRRYLVHTGGLARSLSSASYRKAHSFASSQFEEAYQADEG